MVLVELREAFLQVVGLVPLAGAEVGKQIDDAAARRRFRRAIAWTASKAGSGSAAVCETSIDSRAVAQRWAKSASTVSFWKSGRVPP